VVLAISQSGASPDLLAAVSSARAAGAHIVALVNAQDSPLAQLADDLIPLHAGTECSVAATKSNRLACAIAAWSRTDARCAAGGRLQQAPQRCTRCRRAADQVVSKLRER